MKKLFSVATAASLFFSMSASADVAQVWRCALADGVDGDALDAISEDWLAKAREIDEDVSVRTYFPIAANAEEGDYVFVFYMPDFASWGAFMDAYPDSAVAEVDSGWDEIGPCEVSGLWVTNDFD